LALIDKALAERAVGHVLAWAKTYDPDAVLLPAACALVQSGSGGLAAERLRLACLTHLEARIAEPLAPPADWRRPGELACRCPLCSQLSRFLADPTQPVWTLRAASADRGHVEATIGTAKRDVDVTTDRNGRPYSLVCTKNRASYEARVRQRKQDLSDVRRLGGGSGWGGQGIS
jgi:hypothetical protein